MRAFHAAVQQFPSLQSSFISAAGFSFFFYETMSLGLTWARAHVFVSMAMLIERLLWVRLLTAVDFEASLKKKKRKTVQRQSEITLPALTEQGARVDLARVWLFRKCCE